RPLPDDAPYSLWRNSRVDVQAGQVVHHFLAVSNELSTPKILVCPEDTRQEARNFSDLTNTNISYFVGLDAAEDKAGILLAGDRNIMVFSRPVPDGSTMTFPTNTAFLSKVEWSPTTIHKGAGNAALGDGTVLNLSNAGLRAQLGNSG